MNASVVVVEEGLVLDEVEVVPLVSPIVECSAEVVASVVVVIDDVVKTSGLVEICVDDASEDVPTGVVVV